MRTAVIASVIASAVAMPIAQNLHDRAYYEEKFFNWLSVHKIEATSGDHFVKMIENFANNDDIITAHNNQNLGYELGHNQFSHLSLDEWRAYVKLGLSRPETSTAAEVHQVTTPVSSTPAYIDWTTKGAVTGVKDQGQCGSCWAFSTTGAIEGAYQIAGHGLKSFSEEMFVDCDNRSNGGKDSACNGGLMDNAFDFAKKWGGVCSEADYPYTAGTTKKAGTCDTSCKKDTLAAPTSHVDVPKNDHAAFISALNIGPLSVAIEADQSAFQLYKSGVFSGTCGTNLDHGVLAVAYGIDGKTEYYKIKNSWGQSWGENGYIRLAKDVSQKQGQCGVLSGPASYPKLK